jgi:hypothetical protein
MYLEDEVLQLTWMKARGRKKWDYGKGKSLSMKPPGQS